METENIDMKAQNINEYHNSTQTIEVLNLKHTLIKAKQKY